MAQPRWKTVAPALMACALLLASPGCNKDGGSGGPATGGPDDPGAGEADRPSNGAIRVEESGVQAVVTAERQLRVTVPVESLGQAASGTLSVSVREVDGQNQVATAEATYSVAAGEASEATVMLTAPTDLSEQNDLVKYNLRIEESRAQGVRVTRSLFTAVPQYEVLLEGPSRVAKDKEVRYRVRAQDPKKRTPLVGMPVTVELKKDDTSIGVFSVETGEKGDAIIPVAAEQTGLYTLTATGTFSGTSSALSGQVQVEAPAQRVLLTTDKPIYQPGQTIHLRTLALSRPNNAPVADEVVTLEIEDGKGNKILKRDVRTDAYGIAASDFRLGHILNMGTFKVRALVAETVTERTVEVSRYALPKFEVTVALDKPWYGPGDDVVGRLDTRYFFGKKVAGAQVRIEASTLDVGQEVFQVVMGSTDAEGVMDFSVRLPNTLVGLPLEQGNALVSLAVTVTDTASQVVEKSAAVVVASQPLRVVLVPEATRIVPGLENRVHAFVTDPTGAPQADVQVTLDGAGARGLSGVTDAFGHSELRFLADGSSPRITADLTGMDGTRVNQTFDFGEQAGGAHLIVRTDKSLYDVGETVQVEVLTSEPSGRVYLDWLNDGQAVEMRTLEAQDGRAAFTLDLSSALLGDNRIEAYLVDGDGNLVRAGRTVFARNSSALSVSMTTDKASYTPGEPAQLTFSVQDEAGTPTVAALGVQIVDEAVFALVDARPGLLKTYFELEDAFAQPNYQIAPPVGGLSEVLFARSAETDRDQKRAEGALAALGEHGMMGLSKGSWSDVVSAASDTLDPYFEAERGVLIEQLTRVATEQIAALEAEGCDAGRGWCETLEQNFASLLSERVSARAQGVDFWGNAYAVQGLEWNGLAFSSLGPDEAEGGDDDRVLHFSWGDLGIESVWPGVDDVDAEDGAPLPGAPGGGFADAGAAPPEDPTAEGDEGGDGDDGPRVRRDFPETLYVNPALITGPDGTARVDLNMADSITEWRVSALAHAANGKLGSMADGVTVFQEFFVDIDFPATLTRGDEVDFPIAVYNYLDTAQTVRVDLEAGDWYTPLGAVTASVELQAGEVRGISFPVRVDEVGLQSLTVRAFGDDRSDAVARAVRVQPDGQQLATPQSGALAAGSVTYNPSFGANAVPGSEQLYLNVFPAFLSQAVEGLDSMLQVPSGCFEQTTSTTWPNVLVTEYMEQTGQITPEVQLKAESLISAGYQRLLTFEHPGGGFSWFGTQDPAPFLSVTAFGLMEFSDMARVHEVDPAMIERTRNWLLGQQSADGSWEGDISEFFSFNTSALRNTAFVVWALAASDYQGSEVGGGLDYLRAQLDAEESDPYTLALVANAFAAAAPSDATTSELLDRLDALKQQDGDKVFWDSAGTQTNFYGSGNDAAIATTALVTSALIEAGGYASVVNGALDFLASNKDSLGNFGSTQATVWTLRTLLMAALNGTEGAVGSLTVAVDGEVFATVDVTEDQWDVMTTVDMSALATTGEHEVILNFAGTGKISYNLLSSYHVPWAEAPADPVGPLGVEVAYDRTQLAVDETVQATVTVRSNVPERTNMVLVTVGLPPGFSVEVADFLPYLADNRLSKYEITGKQLSLYITELAGNSVNAFTYRLRANMPVAVQDGGAEAFPYYEPEKKAHAPATMLEAVDN